MQLKETPLFSQDGLSFSTLQLVDDDSLLNENILILKKMSSELTDTQRLPDGIKDSQATYLILKVIYYSQPDQDDFIAAIAYRTLYKQKQALTDKAVQLFVVSVQTPTQETRNPFGYQDMRYQGVYDSQETLLKDVPLISLNELSAEPHNAMFKCFASQTEERQKGYTLLKQSRPELSPTIELLLSALSNIEGEYTQFSPEEVLQGLSLSQEG
jgi:hypothetical protein